MAPARRRRVPAAPRAPRAHAPPRRRPRGFKRRRPNESAAQSGRRKGPGVGLAPCRPGGHRAAPPNPGGPGASPALPPPPAPEETGGVRPGPAAPSQRPSAARPQPRAAPQAGGAGPARPLVRAERRVRCAGREQRGPAGRAPPHSPAGRCPRRARVAQPALGKNLANTGRGRPAGRAGAGGGAPGSAPGGMGRQQEGSAAGGCVGAALERAGSARSSVVKPQRPEGMEVKGQEGKDRHKAGGMARPAGTPAGRQPQAGSQLQPPGRPVAALRRVAAGYRALRARTRQPGTLEKSRSREARACGRGRGTNADLPQRRTCRNQ
ncbi:translation initiation factor IF-2-like [Falco naumanni]|uniref:translation initiation factor IF-2-like n=1 Tax=Falco naumanni TaxID=148594 RepID=UPI001ADDF405|nr:translation initiation factor IF-2-like [Falco naumanni]